MSAVTILQTAVRAAQVSSWFELFMSRWIWLTSMKRNSCSGEKNKAAVQRERESEKVSDREEEAEAGETDKRDSPRASERYWKRHRARLL
jgi:hypothetical protein